MGRETLLHHFRQDLSPRRYNRVRKSNVQAAYWCSEDGWVTKTWRYRNSTLHRSWVIDSTTKPTDRSTAQRGWAGGCLRFASYNLGKHIVLLDGNAHVPDAFHPIRENTQVPRPDGDLLSVVVRGDCDVAFEQEANFRTLPIHHTITRTGEGARRSYSWRDS